MSLLKSDIPQEPRLSVIRPSQPKRKAAQLPSRLAARVVILFQVTLASWTGIAFTAPDSAADSAQEHANKGLELARSGDLKGAEAELRLAIHLSPNDPDYLADLGGILGMQEKPEEASKYFERALKIDPGNLTVRRDLARGQWQLGRLQEAAANLERILQAKPGDPRSLLLLGMVNENLKNYAKAAALLASVPDLVKQRPESIAALARSYYRTGQKQRAKETLECLLNQPVVEAQGVFLGGETASLEGDDETALRLFESIRSTYPDRPVLAYNMALAQYRAGHFPEAERTLADLITAGQPTSALYNLLAWSYYKQDKFQETVRAMDQAIDLEPTRESNYLDLGQMLTEHQLLPVGRTVALKAVERIPGSFRCYMMKGLIETKQGDYADAVASYGRAVALKPDSPEANFNLARMQWLAGMNEEAEVTFEQGIKRFPHDALTYEEYALMLLKRVENGNAAAETRAVALLKQASALDESLSEPHYQLGNLWLRKGRTTAALQELQTAAKLSPKEAKTHYALSRAYRRLGRNERAATELAAYERLRAQQEKPD